MDPTLALKIIVTAVQTANMARRMLDPTGSDPQVASIMSAGVNGQMTPGEVEAALLDHMRARLSRSVGEWDAALEMTTPGD